MNKKKITRNIAMKIQPYRFWIQSVFILLCIWIGIEFFFFTRFLENGGTTAYIARPPGVDGFLPISSMMSFYLFLTTGEIHPAHPAGLFIFIAILLVSFVFGKSFCSWFCPVGFISELVGDFGEMIIKKTIKKKITLPKWLDIPLRSIKYILLAFLLYAVFFLMNVVAVKAFLDSPYNQVADLKLFYFFAHISRISVIVISILFVLSIVIRNFWCRFLCPYGALLGVLSFLSPNKIVRNTKSCIDCGLCSKACPSSIKVDKLKIVLSDECSTCMSCVDSCPVSDTLDLKLLITKKRISKKKVIIGIISIFVLVVGIGMISGNWQNDISKNKYLIYYKYMNSYGHPTGTTELKKFNDNSNAPHSKIKEKPWKTGSTSYGIGKQPQNF